MPSAPAYLPSLYRTPERSALNGNGEFDAIAGNWEISHEIRRVLTTEGTNRGGAVLGAAAVGLQCVAVRGLRDLGRENMAAFSSGDDPGVAGDHDRAGVAGERLLLRRVPWRNPDPEC